MICIDLANVRTKALLSSSESAETSVLGSDKNRERWGCTSAEPRPVIKRNAVLSTLKKLFNYTSFDQKI